MHKNRADIVIIGGGVLGISLAYHLSKQNCSIFILEKESLTCQHASAKNAGMIRQLYREESLTHWAEKGLNSLPKKIKQKYFRQTGSVILDRTSPGHHQHLFHEGKVIQSGDELSYVYTKTDGLIEPEGYVNSLQSEAKSTGKVKIFTGFNAQNICPNGKDNYEIVSRSGEVVEGSIVVNASGAWVNSLFSEAKYFAPAKPFARHLFVSTGWEENLKNSNDLPSHGFFWDERAGWYRRDWSNDENLVSACDTTPADPDNYCPKENPESSVAAKILESVEQLGKNIRIGRGWHCFRTYTEDSLPILGFDSTIPNFYWLAAFGGFGMSTSFAATEDAANEIVTGKSIIASRLHIKRFRNGI